MFPSIKILFISLPFVSIVLSAPCNGPAESEDPCAAIAGKTWVAPGEVRECYSSFPVDPNIKSNIIDVVNKTLAFHASLNFQISAPEPFANDVHEDILADLERISQQSYNSDYDLHLDLSFSVRRLNDGHCLWINNCYDAAYNIFLPIPMVLLQDPDGNQNIHIALEAFEVVSAEFPDAIDFWQTATNGTLQSLSGAKVLLINGQQPLDAVDSNADLTRGFPQASIRQNSFFSSYQMVNNTWTYNLGNFATLPLPIEDQVTLLVQKLGSSITEEVVVPFRARVGNATPFTDKTSYWNNNCLANALTNGKDINASNGTSGTVTRSIQERDSETYSQQTPPVDFILDDSVPSNNFALPCHLQPTLEPLEGSLGDVQFYMLQDGQTGVLALGSFAAPDFLASLDRLLQGLTNLKTLGATKLIIDVTNNLGGFVCAAEWLHRIIVGSKSTTVPNAGLPSIVRAGPLAQLIVQKIVETPGIDPSVGLLYNPTQYSNANNEVFNATDDWLQPPISRVINGKQDFFSQRLGNDCGIFLSQSNAPSDALFDSSKVVIVSNGRCISACATFSVVMSKLEGVRTVVVGGRNDVKQQYCGVVGGQSASFALMDVDVKTTQLKDHPLAAPDLLVNGAQTIVWRLSLGVDNPDEPEEWQDHPATTNLALTVDLANNPGAIWEEIALSQFQ